MNYDRIISVIDAPQANIDQLINERLTIFTKRSNSSEQGKNIFLSQCSICHQVNDQGGNIGPQLDGIGSWGSRALAEKILDPNRNISKAFSVYTLKLKDGTVSSGLFRREEGQVVIFADINGKEFTIDKNDIVEQKLSPFTLMPDHFRETISEDDFSDLLTYILSLNLTNLQ